MKRDMELIRTLLQEFEEGNLQASVEGYDEDAINFHIALLKEMELIDAIVHYSNSGQKPMDFPDMTNRQTSHLGRTRLHPGDSRPVQMVKS